MLTALTPAQAALMPVYRDKWVAIGLATGLVERPAADRAIAEIYHQAGLGMPKILVAASPVAGVEMAQTLPQRASARANVEANMVWPRRNLSSSVDPDVWTDVRINVADEVDARVGGVAKTIRESASTGGSLWDSLWGNMDAAILSLYDFFWRECGVPEAEPLAPYCALAQCGGWWIPYRHYAIVQDRPTRIALDDTGRLHHPTDAACLYGDGWGVWAWHGVRVPQWVIEHPGQITLERIANERNPERRQALVERYGEATQQGWRCMADGEEEHV